MPNQCATSVLTHSVAVAEGVYAPGHLGELTRQFPFELVDDVLLQTRTMQTRVRSLPSRVGVYFVLALALFPGLGYARVWDKLTAGLRQLRTRRTSEKSLRDLRRRLGTAPLELLFTVLAGPVAGPRTPGVCYRRWRTVAFDGCSSAKAPDRPRVCAWLGKHKHRYGRQRTVRLIRVKCPYRQRPHVFDDINADLNEGLCIALCAQRNDVKR